MSILYSPVGDTDPIRDCYDGALLHIIRTYKPSYARIFLSAEMTAKEDSRQVYSKAINCVAPACKLDFIKTDIVDVQLMEKLVPLAEGFLQLRKEYPNEEILLNLSSGTPQMKTVMSFLATDFENVRAIQVDSPQKGSNRAAHATQDAEDIDAVIENNFDNAPDYKCRCHEAPLSLLRRYSIRHQLISLVQNYEYSAALALYNQNKALFADETGKLLKHADLRSKMLIEEAFAVMGKDRYRNSSIRKTNEFLMVMELNQRKGKLVEFIPKLTPFLYELTLFYLGSKLGFNPSRFCYSKQKPSDSWRISTKMLRETAPEVMAHLNKMYAGSFVDNKELSFTNILCMLEAIKAVDVNLLEILHTLRIVEKKQRNKIAHTILMNITEETFKAVEPCLSSAQLVQLLRKAFLQIMQGESIYKYNVYDELNEKIVFSLDKFRS